MEEQISEQTPAPAEALTPKQIERRRKRMRKYMRAYRRKKNGADPERQRRMKARKMARYRRNRKKREAHERGLKRRANAAAKKQAKAERRTRREAIAAEKEAIRKAQGLPEKRPTTAQHRIDAAYTEGFAKGVEAGRAMERAEIEARQRLAAMQHPNAA